jgi:hypothetical protein
MTIDGKSVANIPLYILACCKVLSVCVESVDFLTFGDNKKGKKPEGWRSADKSYN